ncbi:DUF4136 domain-containing protein [Echinicola strongylocentroti]|uniref:DUF4136 domain-containing protein n=1 Tax=Echinicola strongylocentroti TaxID=1795355 RepID=A0A2Z4IMT4_9BACT|nr:DUF4136 domain-containing protein [Echinicola strongylocentroti]AWW32050.1 DUF4136 domain-containing protein [Echinicola strongylocentroti]
MKLRTILSFLAVGGLAGLSWGCLPSGPDYVEDMDIVYTTYQEDYDFQSKSTYSMPDQIVTDVKVDDGDTTYVYMDAKFANPILSEIEQNMESYGWTRVGVEETADMLLMPAGTSTTNYYYYWWYDWWWGGYYPGWWGWYYPPYYPVSSYTTGSLILVLTDPSAAETNPINKSNAAWLSVSNGILTYYNDIERVTDAIDQAFDQSPYLQTQ